VQNTGSSITLSVHPAVNGYPYLFRPQDDEGGEEEEWHPQLSHTVAWYKLAL